MDDFIFTNLDPHAEPLAPTLTPAYPWNWKLVLENFMEPYRNAYLHKSIHDFALGHGCCEHTPDPMRTSISVNGATTVVNVEPHHLLTDVLRDECGLTSVHAACEQGACGSCTVLLDDTAVRSCLLFAVEADGHKVTTVEGLGSGGGERPPARAAAG